MSSITFWRIKLIFADLLKFEMFTLKPDVSEMSGNLRMQNALNKTVLQNWLSEAAFQNLMTMYVHVYIPTNRNTTLLWKCNPFDSFAIKSEFISQSTSLQMQFSI